MKIAFITKNIQKFHEVEALLQDSPVEVMHLEEDIAELQTDDDEKLIRDKLLKAFKLCSRPVFVEHTSLLVSHLNGFPGGLTELFWNKLKEEKFADLIGNFPDNTVVARTIIGFCDGKRFYFFPGEIKGHVPVTPRGRFGFQWDPVFIPEGHDLTFAEMGTEEKNKVSMRMIAYKKFTDFLISNGRTY